ncbi:hypothetical protein AE618_25985 [Bosea vaviloviae]|uniref:Uncharacterized protein n=2 Tax=Bosea vaviloviae TaxID=1526658 RepID=A0A0N1EYK5_9HYPH|nr:hypothetical protein AE618_25985 [Bosea vaviloviae]
MIDEKALYVAATAALNARRAANGWPATTLDKMLTPDRDAWIADVRAAILSYEAAKPLAEPVAGRLISDEPLEALAYARTTAANDDMTKPGTIERQRHCDRLAAMQAASDEIVRLHALSVPASKDGG